MALSEYEVVKTIKEALDNQQPSTAFDEIWSKSVNQNNRLRSFRKVYAIPLIAIISCIMMFTAGFASHQYFSRTVDKTDYPFVNDKKVIGKWKTVDFVRDINDFQAGKQSWGGDLYLKELVFVKGGRMLISFNIDSGNLAFSPATWTKGKVLNENEKTASAYDIREINGKTYLFVQWKNGDYVFRGAEPHYYVMEKQDDLDYTDYKVKTVKEDKIDCPFVNDPQMIGKWDSVDFVKEVDQFKPDSRNWLDDLYLLKIKILEDGKVDFTYTSKEISSENIFWTKGLIVDKSEKTASKCTFKEINGDTYMFYEWKSGDYTYRGMKPYYYVLKKAD